MILTMYACLRNYSNSFQDKAQTAFGVIYAIYAPFIVSVNVILVVSIIATKQSMKNSSNLLIVCLSISDSLTGAILMPIQSIESIWYDSKNICMLRMIMWYLQMYFTGTSINFMLLLAVDRYMHMNPNFQRTSSKLSTLFKRPNIYVTIFCFGLLPTSAMMVILHFIPKGALLYFNAIYMTLLSSSVVIFVALYTRGYLKIRRHVAENPVYSNRAESDSNQVPEYVNQLFKTILLVLIAFILSWVPSIVMFGIMSVSEFIETPLIDPDTFLVCDSISWFLYYTNSAANALIIFYRNTKSRDWFGAKVIRIFQRQRSEILQRQRSEIELPDVSV